PSADGESGGTFAEKSLPTPTENAVYHFQSFTDSGSFQNKPDSGGTPPCRVQGCGCPVDTSSQQKHRPS
ncbi:MAG: hypothetical protein IJU51_02305, partial [Clostridia bacterium]|nr:hypothetical protein [Clostridia bacterium]